MRNNAVLRATIFLFAFLTTVGTTSARIWDWMTCVTYGTKPMDAATWCPATKYSLTPCPEYSEWEKSCGLCVLVPYPVGGCNWCWSYVQFCTYEEVLWSDALGCYVCKNGRYTESPRALGQCGRDN